MKKMITVLHFIINDVMWVILTREYTVMITKEVRKNCYDKLEVFTKSMLVLTLFITSSENMINHFGIS